MRRPHWVLAILVGAVARTGAAQGPAPTAPPEFREGVRAVLDAFADRPLVAVAETHRVKEVHDFLRAVIDHPEFSHRVDDVVVEFGNARYQPMMDRYIAGADTPIEEVRRAWRDTTQWLVWDSPLYEEFFAAIRERNRRDPEGRRVRVVLVDPPIDWSAVHTKEDYAAYENRDVHWLSVVEREVLDKGRHALVFAGGVHLVRRDPRGTVAPLERAGLGEALDRKRPGQSYVIWVVAGRPPYRDLVPEWPRGTMVSLAGTPLGAASFHAAGVPNLQVRISEGSETRWVPLVADQWPRSDAMVDAVLYLGPDRTTVEAPAAVYAEPEYYAELRRRAGVLTAAWGFDCVQQLEELVPR